MVKAQVRIETHGQRGQGTIFGQHAISQGEHCINGISWRTAVAVGEIEVKGELALTPNPSPIRWARGRGSEMSVSQVIRDLHHAAELLEILARSGAFDSE